MPDDQDSLRDKDGYIYEKNWAGQYEKKFDLLSQDYARDRTDLEVQSHEHTWDGTPLYRPRQTSYSSSSSSSCAEGGLSLIYAFIFLAFALAGVGIALTPILAPIMISNTEGARKRGDLAGVQKWEPWAVGLSLVAFFAVLASSALIGYILYAVVKVLIQEYAATVPADWVFYAAVAIGVVIFVIAFITGISPTAITYLHYKEASLKKAGRTGAAQTAGLFKWGFGIVAGSVVGLIVLGGVGVMGYGAVSLYLSK